MKVKILAGFLLVSLLLNIRLLYLVLDQAVSVTYTQQAVKDSEELALQLTKILAIVLENKNLNSQEVIAEANVRAFEPYEKEGYIWVGQLGLGFGAQGKLEAIKVPEHLLVTGE